MAEAIIDKVKCAKCGSDVRDNTQFCYSCGDSLAAAEIVPEESGVSGKQDAAAASENAPDNGAKLARAAEERKKARVERKKVVGYRWDPPESSGVGLMLLYAGAIAAIVLVIVFLGVRWR